MKKLLVLLFICWGWAVAQPVAPRLLSPAHESVVRIANPLLTWVPAAPGQAGYTVKLVQLLDNQSPYAALMSNPLLLHQQVTQPSLVYPVTAPLLQQGQTYVWQVCLQVRETGEACSEAWVFRYETDSIPKEKLPDLRVFPKLSAKPSGPVYHVRKDLLPFALEGQYALSELKYEVLNSANKPLKTDEWEHRVYAYGSNHYALKIKGIKKGYYTLVVRDHKGMTYYLRFAK
ncbi:MAG: hypothetical protein KF690_05240 [Bacteroidetes bacterium]|nr:hypothetical protein [Bacteroidota bacterium]